MSNPNARERGRLSALRECFGEVRKGFLFAHAFLKRVHQNQRKCLAIRAILVDPVFGAGIVEYLLQETELIGIDRLSNLCAHENLHRSRLPPPGVGYSAYVLNVCEAWVLFPEKKAPIGPLSAPLTGDGCNVKIHPLRELS